MIQYQSILPISFRATTLYATTSIIADIFQTLIWLVIFWMNIYIERERGRERGDIIQYWLLFMRESITPSTLFYLGWPYFPRVVLGRLHFHVHLLWWRNRETREIEIISIQNYLCNELYHTISIPFIRENISTVMLAAWSMCGAENGPSYTCID